MKRRFDWLEGREIADPDTAVVSHSAGGFLYGLREILNLTPRAACGASLIADCTAPEPTPESSVCADCANRANHRSRARRLLDTYRGLCDRHEAGVLNTLMVVAVVAGFATVAAAFARTGLVWLPISVLIAAAVLVRLAPDHDDPIDDPDDESDCTR